MRLPWFQAASVPAGFVAVIKSNVQDQPAEACHPIRDERTEKLSVPLVPKGCRGVWSESLCLAPIT